MKKVHIVLQGKGGVGKSLVSSLLAQYHLEQEQSVKCIDADPVNPTLLGYQALDVKHIKLMDGNQLDERRFDEMMEEVLNHDHHYVIDSGAASFIPMTNYLIENNAIELINQSGKQAVVHCPVIGGQALLDTLNGLVQLVEQLSEETPVMVWLNEYFGKVIWEGKPFDEMKAYTKCKHRIKGLVHMARQSENTFGKDMAQMLNHKLTFAEVNAHPDFSLMAKQRLTLVKRAIFNQMALAL